MKLDILAIGAHPDDVELGCAGTLMKHIDLGHQVGILDLTRGELGTRGSAEIRDSEAADAASIMGITTRENLCFRDGFFVNDEAHQLAIIKAIRKYQPTIVLANATNDRHPDHGKAAKLVVDACFLAGLAKINTFDDDGLAQQKWRPTNLYHYNQGIYIEPDFVVDITGYMERKMDAIKAYKTQFYDPNSTEEQTFISTPEYMDLVKARALEFGTIVGFKYAEGFNKNKRIGVDDLMKIK